MKRSFYLQIGVLVLCGLFADWIANQRPLIYWNQTQFEFPVCSISTVSEYSRPIQDYPLHSTSEAWVLWPPIRFHVTISSGAVSPVLAPPLTWNSERQAYHFLGTDELGRDVAALVIHGTRWSLGIGLAGTCLAFMIGTGLGYLSARTVRLRPDFALGKVIHLSLALGLFLVYTVHLNPGSMLGIHLNLSRQAILQPSMALQLSGAIMLLLVLTVITWPVQWIPGLDRKIHLPWDSWMLRGIGLLQALPAVLVAGNWAWLSGPGWSTLLGIYLTLFVPVFVWFSRQEIRSIQARPYWEAAEALGIRESRLLINYVIPNAWPVWSRIIGHTLASAILLEAALSYLGMGLAPGTPSWGSLLMAGVHYPYAWWLTLTSIVVITGTVFTLMYASWRHFRSQDHGYDKGL